MSKQIAGSKTLIKSISWIFAIILCVLASIFVGVELMGSKTAAEDRVLRVAFQGTWKTPLNPPSQHMMIEDAILANEFESLLCRGENGLVLPLAAKFFAVNEDFTVYDFKIDERRKFSDGSPLTAQDFKSSWEQGLRLRKNSANRNAEDVLQPLIGFEAFDESGKISGIEVVDTHTLRLHYKQPFRMALMHLTGARFAAFKQTDTGMIGTGRFAMQEVSNDRVTMLPNKYHPDGPGHFSRIEILGLSDPYKAIESGQVDLVAYSSRRFAETPEVGSTAGVEDTAGWMHLNSLNGRFFADMRLRQAFQFLVFEVLKEHKADVENLPTQFTLDHQTFLPLQAGRIPDEEAEAIIRQGGKFVELLVSESKKRPIKTSIYGAYSFILEGLRSKGLIIENKVFDTVPDLMNDFYLGHTQDVLLCGASVHVSDPDGMYHLLGKSGAITSPMIHTPRVVSQFETGRYLVDQGEIPKFYENVTRTILEEVPSVHIGFIAHGYLYRKDRLKPDRTLLERHFDQILHIFHPADL